jgi:hypothetical protein
VPGELCGSGYEIDGGLYLCEQKLAPHGEVFQRDTHASDLAPRRMDSNLGYPGPTNPIHDKDVQASHLFTKIGWKCTEYIDPNHCKKAIFTRFKNRFKRYNKVTDELVTSLKNLCDRLVHSVPGLDERRRPWLKVESLFCGDHSQCESHRSTSVRSAAKDSRL